MSIDGLSNPNIRGVGFGLFLDLLTSQPKYPMLDSMRDMGTLVSKAVTSNIDTYFLIVQEKNCSCTANKNFTHRMSNPTKTPEVLSSLNDQPKHPHSNNLLPVLMLFP